MNRKTGITNNTVKSEDLGPNLGGLHYIELREGFNGTLLLVTTIGVVVDGNLLFQ